MDAVYRSEVFAGWIRYGVLARESTTVSRTVRALSKLVVFVVLLMASSLGSCFG